MDRNNSSESPKIEEISINEATRANLCVFLNPQDQEVFENSLWLASHLKSKVVEKERMTKYQRYFIKRSSYKKLRNDIQLLKFQSLIFHNTLYPNTSKEVMIPHNISSYLNKAGKKFHLKIDANKEFRRVHELNTICNFFQKNAGKTVSGTYFETNRSLDFASLVAIMNTSAANQLKTDQLLPKQVKTVAERIYSKSFKQKMRNAVEKSNERTSKQVNTIKLGNLIDKSTTLL